MLHVPESGNFSPSTFAKAVTAELNSHGYTIVRFGPNLLESRAIDNATLLLSNVGQIIDVFELPSGPWRQIDVDPSRPPNKSRGVGRIPLHLDFVNAENPPDVVCLFCIRPDPQSGGCNLIAPFENVILELSQQEIDDLTKPVFHDGQVKNLSKIGADINPFPVLSSSKKWKFRYTSNMLSLELPKNIERALFKLEDILNTVTVRVMLERFDLLLVDQHRALHGREPLGDSQEKIAPERRRLLLHSFLRYYE